MTIGIGVLCSSQPRPHPIRPDCLILIADTMGSTETDSTDSLHKLCVEPDEKLYVAGAGDLGICNDAASLIKQNIAALSKRNHGHIWDAINKAIHECLVERFAWDVLAPKYMFAKGLVFENQKEPITAEWQEYNPDLALLVGTFHESGLALLYTVAKFQDSAAWVHFTQFPGHMAIGSGGYNSRFWLKFREQHLGLHPRQSAYHAYEAKIMAATVPTVNANTEIVVAFADRHYVLTNENPESKGCPFTLDELKEWYKKYGPQDANPLGHKVKQSASRR